jgi:hypothetical protein
MQEIKNQIRTSWVKLVIFSLISLSLLFLNFWFENSSTEAADIELAAPSSLESIEQHLLLGRGGKAAFQDFSDTLKLTLNETKNYWFNNFATTKNVNIIVDNLVFIPEKAAFNLEVEERAVKLSVLSGDVYVGFLDADLKRDNKTYDKYDNSFIARMVVGQGAQIDVLYRKINDQLALLLREKLEKEMRLSTVSSTFEKSSWVLENQKLDLQFLAEEKEGFRSLYGGFNPDESTTSKFFEFLRDNFTFVPEKIAQKKAEDANEDFQRLLASDSLITLDDFSNSELGQFLTKMKVFDNDDQEYNLRQLIFKRLFASADLNQRFNFLAQAWPEVYPAQNLDDYFEFLDDVLNKPVADKEYKMFLEYQNQLFDNLFLRFDTFYRDVDFEKKSFLEEQLLAASAGSRLENELKQSLLSKKITYFKRLRRLFFEEQVELEEAQKIGERLIVEARALLPENTEDGAAVLEIFADQLSDVADFLAYLNEPEYHLDIYGSTYKEKFDTYLLERDTIWNFIDIRENILGEEIEVELTLSEVEDEIFEVFDSVPLITDLSLLDLEDVNQRYVKVSAVVEGYAFEGRYDRYTELIDSIVAYGEDIAVSAVRLDNLLDLMLQEFSDLNDFVGDLEEDERTAEDLIESGAQRAARLFVAEKVSEFGFLVEIQDVKVLDLEQAIYTVDKVYLEIDEDQLVEVTFDLKMNGEMVQRLYVRTSGDPKVFENEYTLDELKLLVEGELEDLLSE